MDATTNDEDPVAGLARERFKVDYLFPLQRLVMANILDAFAGGEGSDGPETYRQVAILPTGFGKSLCFQLPALILEKPTLVVFPLLALMSDQERRLESLGIGSALFRGGLEEAERKAREKAVEKGEARIIITNPESLRGRLLDFLKETGPAHVAIDEAHCVSEWGEDFRPSYLELGKVLESLAPPVTSAFTATASPLILDAMSRILFGSAPFSLVQGSPDRANIHYSVKRTLARERSLELLLREKPRPAIVFCSSRDGSQILAERLRRRLGSEEIRFYHAGLERGEKKAIEDWFFRSGDGILVSTCAYGLGVDKKNVRTVIHYDPPASIEAYLQESGRGGRDGEQSWAILLNGPEDEAMLEREKDEVRKARRKALLAYAKSGKGCRREGLLSMLGAELQGSCSGCDACDGEAGPGYEGEGALLEFASRNARRFDREEFLRLILGKSGEPPVCPASGALAGWREEDAAAALWNARAVGMVAIAEKGPWKGRISPIRQPRPLPPRLRRPFPWPGRA